MKRVALYLLLLSGLVVQFAAGLEETPRTSKFEPERKVRFRNGGRTRTPKHRTSSMATAFGGETQRPRFGQLYPSHNSFNAKPSQPLNGNGLIEAGDFVSSLSGLGGLQSTQLPPQSGTNPQRNSEFLKGKICIGTNGRMSVPSNKQHHYRNLRDRFTNCTYVDGNLEITWLNDSKFDLSFLQHIREVTGYVLISHVDITRILLPRLQIIRGRTLFKLNISDQEFGLFVTYSQMNTLELPALRDILNGSVGIFNNYNLCYMKSLDWDEILSGVNASMNYMYNFTSPERQCAPCHESCAGGCWGEGPENCQQFSKSTCSPQCSGGRCFGTQPRECCHLFCAGGCTGPTQKDCLACRNFFDDGVCKQDCPPMQKYNPTNYLWESNPEGKYAYGATCVRKCPEHLLKDSGACVRTCPPNKTATDGECMPCNGACPKTCPGQGIVHSGNIDSFRGCTVIDGSLEILEQTFNGYQHVFANFSFGARFIRLNPDRLEVFSTLREVTGYINIQADHEQFTNLSYFRNLEVIGGRVLMENYFASLYIVKSSLKSLELKSLKQINAGAVVILENKNLCFAEKIQWKRLRNSKKEEHPCMVSANRNHTECENEGLICHKECTADGCWGGDPEQCLDCRNKKYNGECLEGCGDKPGLYEMSNDTCAACDTQCKEACYGAGPDKCHECKNVLDEKHCLAECPDNKYNRGGLCTSCHATCIGCKGPRDTISEDGCISCHRAIINSDNNIERCLALNDTCPAGYYEWQGQSKEGPLQFMSGKYLCRKCHPRCERCSGYGFHTHVCQKCVGYKNRDVCEDECPQDHYADEEKRECFPCNTECRGCSGPTNADCHECRHVQLFTDGMPSENSTNFICPNDCPPEFPHKRYEWGPYCSEDMQNASSLNRANLSVIVTLACIATIFLACAAIFIYCCYKRVKEKEASVKMSRVLSGCEDSEPLRPTNVRPNLTKLRIVKEAELRRGGILGMGAFGRVFKGVWIPENENVKIPVAIKVLTEMSGAQSSKEFLDEAYIMASVEHPNLLKLLAVCMTSQMMLITQLMPLGSLLDYVRSNRDKIGSKALLNWSTQIAKGMAYLEERRLVHRDLAARNVLVQTPSMVKITDFGLAKLLDVDSDEYKAPGGKMPIKWLALECIRNRIFTSKSDVWAFGVTIWELLTFGARPYENIAAKDVPELIEVGHKLPQPEICTLDIYCILLTCWHLDADSRPHFKELAEQFAEKASDPGRYLVIKGDKFMRLPSYTNQDEKDLIRTLAPVLDGPEPVVEADEYLQPKIMSAAHQQQHSSLSHEGNESAEDQVPKSIRYCRDPLKQQMVAGMYGTGADELDQPGNFKYHNHLYNNTALSSIHNQRTLPRDNGIGVGTLRLDLPLDEDDYLMPTNPNSAGTSTAGYMDLINGPPQNAGSIDNPEYLLDEAAAAAGVHHQTMPKLYSAAALRASMMSQKGGGAPKQQSRSIDNLTHSPKGLPCTSISVNSLMGPPPKSPMSISDGGIADSMPTQELGIPISPIEMNRTMPLPSVSCVTVIGGGGSVAIGVGAEANGSNMCNTTNSGNIGGSPGAGGVVVGVESSSQSSSEHEYYNDLQRELQPLHRNETTV